MRIYEKSLFNDVQSACTKTGLISNVKCPDISGALITLTTHFQCSFLDLYLPAAATTKELSTLG